MVLKKVQFEQATQLRKRGFTYAEISKIVDVSKSTISLWFSRETWSQSITSDNKKRAAKDNKKRISLLNRARSNQNTKLYTEAERSAVTEYKHYKNNPLFMAGLMLYLGNGDTSEARPIRISSTNMNIHRIFIRFAMEFLGVSREMVHFWLLLHPNASKVKVSQTWSKGIRIPLSQFYRHQIVKSGNTLHDGAGNTIIGSVVLKKKLLKWIDLASKEL
jgi:hypothetical protein